MKKWTSHQARGKQLLDAEQINSELRDHQSSMTSLDRTQLPVVSFDEVNLAPYALQRAYTVTLTPAIGSAGVGEQGIADAGVPADQFISATYLAYGGGYRNLYQGSLPGFRGGNLYIEVQGCAYVNPLCHQTRNNAYPPNPKFLNLRVLVAGVNVAESFGSGSGGCEGFRLFGTAQLPPGDHAVVVQWRGVGPGEDDPIVENTSSLPINQYHIWSAKLLAIGRWR